MFGAAGAITRIFPHGGREVSTALATPQSTGPLGPSATTGPPETPRHTSDPRASAITRPVLVMSKGSRCAVFNTPTPSSERPAPARRNPGGGFELRLMRTG